jgi:hypothetical protein
VINKNATVRLFGGMAVVGTLLLSTACGGSGGSGGGTSSSQSGQNGGQGNGGNDAMAAYRACMQKQGVTMPGRGAGKGPGGGGGASGGTPTARPTGRPSGMPSMSAKQQKAAQACASLRPQGGGFGSRPGS